MGITARALGTLKNGKTVTCFTLENSRGQQAVVTDLGAAWLSMRTPDRDGALADVLLSYDKVEALLENDGHLGAIVGRNANRIGGASFQLNGKTYTLEKNNGESNLHSGPHYLEQRLYRAVKPSEGVLPERSAGNLMENPSENLSEERLEGRVGKPEEYLNEKDSTACAAAITFLLESPAGDQGYPGTLSISVTYRLMENGAFRIQYQLQAGEEATLCNFTNHAYFNLAGHQAGSCLDHRLWINAEAITEGGADSVPRGRLLPVEGTPFDFTEAKPIGRDIGAAHPELLYAGGYDHNFCLNQETSAAAELGGAFAPLCHAAAVMEPVSGRRMDVYTDLPGLQLYTGNFLNPSAAGKDGAFYHPRDGFALETQYYPNAINVPGWEKPVIGARETRRYETVYRFGVGV